VTLQERYLQFTTDFPSLKLERKRSRITSSTVDLWHPEWKMWPKKCDNWLDHHGVGAGSFAEMVWCTLEESGTVLLHHDNALSHISLVLQ
jgi:hypothetical protein